MSLSMPTTTTTNKPIPRRLWNLSRLYETDIHQLYKTTLADNLTTLHIRLQHLNHNPPTDKPDIDQLTHSFTDAIHNTLDSVLGTKSNKQYQKNSWFWTDHLQSLVNQREELYRRLKHSDGLIRAHTLRQYENTKNIIRLVIRKRKRETWREFIQHLTTQDYPLTTRQIKNMRQKRKPTHTFTSPLGPQAATDTMAQQLATTFSGSLLNHSLPTAPPLAPTPIDTTTYPSPFTIQTVELALKRIPNRKALGSDHLKAEMLKAGARVLIPVISSLFSLCWHWSYTPKIWRQAQVVPIYKKGDPKDPANYRPISLTSHMRKLMEHCISDLIPDNSPHLDISQGGFRPQRSALDQVTCLQHIHHHHTHTKQPPTMIFLDIKSAYDTVDRSVIWNYIHPTSSPPLLNILRNLFDYVNISVLISGFESTPFSPTTGVLQGSVLSPVLYSLYINRLPHILRLADNALNTATKHLPTPMLQHTTLNSLLYADDIAIIGTPQSLPTLLQAAEQTSYELGFRWHPTKCVVLSPPQEPPQQYQLYNITIPQQPSFRYLGVPISDTGRINYNELIAHNRQAGLSALHSLVPLGFNPHGFPPTLLISLYKQFIRPTMEYGLAIAHTNKRHMTIAQQAQQQSLRRMFSGHPRSETAVIQHLAALPPMHDRSTILQAKYINRSQYLPPDSLLHQLIPHMQSPRSPWTALTRSNTLWPKLSATGSENRKTIRSFLNQSMNRNRKPNTLVFACPPSTRINPLLTLPMSTNTRRLLIRWRRGWIPGKPTPCPCQPMTYFTRKHSLECPLLPILPPPIHPMDPDLHPVDAILNSLPEPNLPKPKRKTIADYWIRTWPILLLYVTTAEALSKAHPYITNTPEDTTFSDWLTPSEPTIN